MRAKVGMYIVKRVLCIFYSLRGTLGRPKKEIAARFYVRADIGTWMIESTSHVVLLGTEENPSSHVHGHVAFSWGLFWTSQPASSC
jgi:hypothetical protein